MCVCMGEGVLTRIKLCPSSVFLENRWLSSPYFFAFHEIGTAKNYHSPYDLAETQDVLLVYQCKGQT